MRFSLSLAINIDACGLCYRTRRNKMFSIATSHLFVSRACEALWGVGKRMIPSEKSVERGQLHDTEIVVIKLIALAVRIKRVRESSPLGRTDS